MNEQRNRVVEGVIRAISVDDGEIRIDGKWYDAAPGLVKQAKEYFTVGTQVKASIEDNTIKSLVKQDERLIG